MKNIILNFSVIISILLVGNVFAGADDNISKITSLRYAEDGIHIQFDTPPTACNSGSQNRMHAILQKASHSNYETVASGLMAAYAANQTIKWIFYLDSSVPTSCNSSLLILTALEVGQ